MLHRTKDLVGDRIVAHDGEIGKVDEVYFDDEQWALRYLVVNTGGWLSGRKVLISPAALDVAGSSEDSIRVKLSREQVEKSPDVDTEKPVSRRYEEAYARHYGYSLYWTPSPEGTAARTARERAAAVDRKLEAAEHEAEKSHLRSSAAVIGYAIEALDGSVGHVEDLVIDDDDWKVADLVVDTGHWLPGKKVLVPPSAVEDIDWKNRLVRVRLRREELERRSPGPL